MPFVIPVAVVLSQCIEVGGCGWPRSVKCPVALSSAITMSMGMLIPLVVKLVSARGMIAAIVVGRVLSLLKLLATIVTLSSSLKQS